MKKFLTLLLLVFFTTSANAVSIPGDHLSFMGIPLNGTISNFQQKLAAKGVKYDAQATKYVDDPTTRVYKGSFAGHKCSIHVDFVPTSKIVFSAAAFIDFDSYKYASEECFNIATDLLSKYDEHFMLDTNEKDNYSISIYNNSDKWIGFINIVVVDYENGTYGVMVQYGDALNLEKYNKYKSRDL